MTLVVVIIMWNLSYIMTLFLILVNLYGQVHLLLPHSLLLYLKFYVKEKVMNYFTKTNVLVERNVIVVEI
jgi:hypothetical protein